MKQKIAILGGGQLGRMLIQAAINLDLEIHILDPDVDAPCKNIASSFTVGSLNDFEAVYQFGQKADILSIEIENVHVDALLKLQAEGKKVYPQPEIIRLIQDKGEQKLFYKKHNIPSPSFVLFENRAEIIRFFEDKKEGLGQEVFFQKLRKGGYDGRGVKKIASRQDLQTAFDAPSFIESAVKVEKEISLIVARNEQGEIASFPIVEMVFNPELNLVDYLFAPADIEPQTAEKARKLAKEIIQNLGLIGLLAIEMFVDKKGNLLVNEMAPRPHNSGHHTIEANFSSQYEQHLRAILNLPLASTQTRSLAAMVNLIGEKGYEGEVVYRGIEEVLKMEGVYIHLYGKKNTKPGRKMGHITILGSNVEELKRKVKEVKKRIKIIA